ncbi:MAG: uncharacterized protein K0S63_739 [Gammaproteobacteria bacterium]|jgi:hypothetical protein|nr:uncharacterized protein [Gammaproteobacteria bacterium]
MKKYIILNILFFQLFLSNHTFAAATDAGYSTETQAVTPSHFFMALSGGLGIARVGQAQIYTANYQLPILYEFLPRRALQSSALYGFSLGMEFPIFKKISMQLGVGYYDSGLYTVNGTIHSIQAIYQPSYAYRYKIQTRQLLGESKLLFTLGKKQNYHPYLYFAAGEGFINASNFEVARTDTSSDPDYSVSFMNARNEVFSYGTGMGIDIDFMKHWRMGLGYRYIHAGPADLGLARWVDGPENILPGKLTQGALAIHEFLLQASYFF